MLTSFARFHLFLAIAPYQHWLVRLLLPMLLFSSIGYAQQEVKTADFKYPSRDKFQFLSGVKNFGDPNLPKLKQLTQSLRSSSTSKSSSSASSPNTMVITFLGDSHIASDFFSGYLRQRMQRELGDAGIGWIPPIAIKGQYHTAIKWESSKAWQLTSSRTTHHKSFPLGGFIATAPNKGESITLEATIPTSSKSRWDLTAWYLSPSDQTPFQLRTAQTPKASLSYSTPWAADTWRQAKATVTLPVTLTTQERDLSLGGFWLQKANTPGVIVSMVGVNGTQSSILNKWQPMLATQMAAFPSNLVILSYGTNEAFNYQFDGKTYQAELIQTIKNVRKMNPNAAVLLISPPESFAIKDENLSCEERQPQNFMPVKWIQLSVAHSEKTLYWDWQAAMGGHCVIEQLFKEKRAVKDLIHFTRKGYEEMAELFYNDLITLLLSHTKDISTTTTH